MGHSKVENLERNKARFLDRFRLLFFLSHFFLGLADRRKYERASAVHRTPILLFKLCTKISSIARLGKNFFLLLAEQKIFEFYEMRGQNRTGIPGMPAKIRPHASKGVFHNYAFLCRSCVLQYTARAHERQFADFFMDPTIEMFPRLKMTLVEAAQSLIVMGLIEFHDEKGRARGGRTRRCCQF